MTWTWLKWQKQQLVTNNDSGSERCDGAVDGPTVPHERRSETL